MRHNSLIPLFLYSFIPLFLYGLDAKLLLEGAEVPFFTPENLLSRPGALEMERFRRHASRGSNSKSGRRQMGSPGLGLNSQDPPSRRGG